MDGCGCGSLCQEETELLLKVVAFPDQQQRTLRMLVAAMKRAGVERDRRDRASALEREREAKRARTQLQCARELITEAMTHGQFTACPECAQMYRKDDQCMHMTCNACRVNFCYVCGQRSNEVCSRGRDCDRDNCYLQRNPGWDNFAMNDENAATGALYEFQRQKMRFLIGQAKAKISDEVWESVKVQYPDMLTNVLPNGRCITWAEVEGQPVMPEFGRPHAERDADAIAQIGAVFATGMRVRVTADVARCQQLQSAGAANGFGWNAGMEGFCGQVGVVESMNGTGVSVAFGASAWVYNPAALTTVLETQAEQAAFLDGLPEAAEIPHPGAVAIATLLSQQFEHLIQASLREMLQQIRPQDLDQEELGELLTIIAEAVPDATGGRQVREGIRNAQEQAGAFSTPCCTAGHRMVVTEHSGRGCSDGYVCRSCGGSGAHRQQVGGGMRRWFCRECSENFCFLCQPEFGGIPAVGPLIVGDRVQLVQGAQQRGVLKAGAVGELIENDGSDDMPYNVRVEAEGTYWYPAAELVRVSTAAATRAATADFARGERVRVSVEAARAEELAAAEHGGWNPAMADYCGREGIVIHVREGGVRVDFGDRQWTWNSLCLTREDLATRRPTVGDNVVAAPGVVEGCLTSGLAGIIVEDDRSAMPYKVIVAGQATPHWYTTNQPPLQCFSCRNLFPFKVLHACDRYRENQVALVETAVETSPRVGDQVTVLASWQDVRRLADGHGGWIEDMRGYCGQTGAVQAINDEDGDVVVQFDDGESWWYIPPL
jgi:hypothetical protein